MLCRKLCSCGSVDHVIQRRSTVKLVRYATLASVIPRFAPLPAIDRSGRDTRFEPPTNPFQRWSAAQGVGGANQVRHSSVKSNETVFCVATCIV